VEFLYRKWKIWVIRGAFHLMAWTVRPKRPWVRGCGRTRIFVSVSKERFGLCFWILKYLAKMDLILILPKLSGQIGRKPIVFQRFAFHSIIWPFWPVCRVNGKRPRISKFLAGFGIFRKILEGFWGHTLSLPFLGQKIGRLLILCTWTVATGISVWFTRLFYSQCE
jgi:hypothetical protein